MNILKSLRNTHQLTQAQLASILNVHQSTVARLEKKVTSIPQDILDKLILEFGSLNGNSLLDSFLLFVKHARTSLTLMDRNMNIREVSQGLLSKRGYSYSQALALDLTKYASSDFNKKLERALQSGFLQSGKFGVSFDSIMKTIEGREIYLNVRLTPILGTGKEPLILSETTDISDTQYSAERFNLSYL